MTDTVLAGSLSGLSLTLHAQFSDWLERRKPQEEKMLRAYQDMMRISRDDDTKETGTSKAQKSKVFVGSTRGKIRSARAKIKDSLFGNGDLPFDTKPTNEKLKGFSDTVEEILSYQLIEGKFSKVVGTGVDTLCTYGTGFIFGPFVKRMKKQSVQAVEGALKEMEFEYDCPYFEHARTMDCYPDPDAEDASEGNGIYWAARKQPEFIRTLKEQDGYDGEAIDKALTQKGSSFTDQGSDRTDSARMNMYRYTKEGRIWFVRFFGLVKKSQLADWKKESPPGDDADERVEAIVIMAGGYVIKADENPYKLHKRPVRRCVYEDVEHEMWGVGVAENNDPNQRVINAAFRLFIEGKAYALLKMGSIDRSKFSVKEDFKAFPGKLFDMKPGLSPDERKSAMIWHDTPDVTGGWENVIALSEQFSDDDTGITKYTQGNDAQHLNKTATGVSMIMNASSLPIKEVLSNIDQMWIDDAIEDLIDWNLEHLEPATVKEILGEEQAQVWAQIKQYGKTNFMEWFATGSATFMAKEVLLNKLHGFLQIVASNEILAQHVDISELLQQTWDVAQIGKESPVLTEEDMQKKASSGVNAQAMEHIKEVERGAAKIIQQAKDQAQAAEQAAAEAKRQEQFKMADMASRDRAAERAHELAMAGIADKVAARGLTATLTGAQIDKLQADTLASLAKAGATASPELQAAGENKEETDENGVPVEPKPDPLETLASMHGDLIGKVGELMGKHGETLDALKKASGKRKRTLSVENGKKVAIDEPIE